METYTTLDGLSDATDAEEREELLCQALEVRQGAAFDDPDDREAQGVLLALRAFANTAGISTRKLRQREMEARFAAAKQAA